MSEVKVPRGVLTGLEAVRDSGLTNMFGRPVVVELAREMGFDRTAAWIESHRREYAEGIFHGFETGRSE